MGDNCVKIIQAPNWTDVKETVNFEDDAGYLNTVYFTNDGQIMTVATKTGVVYNFVTQLPAVYDARGTELVHLTSLKTVTVLDVTNVTNSQVDIEISVEPTVIGIGHGIFATGSNNVVRASRKPPTRRASSATVQMWYYTLADGRGRCVSDRRYPGAVASVSLNETHAAVLSQGRVILDPVVPPQRMYCWHTLHGHMQAAPDGDVRTFPENTDTRDVSSAYLSMDFLVYTTVSGIIAYYALEVCARARWRRHSRFSRGNIASSPGGTTGRQQHGRVSPQQRHQCVLPQPRCHAMCRLGHCQNGLVVQSHQRRDAGGVSA